MRLIYAPLCRLLLLAAALLISLSGGVLLHVYTLPVLALACFAAWPRVRVWAGWSHGTARMANYRDLMRHSLLGRDGLVIGRASFVDPPTKGQALRCLVSPFVGSVRAVRLMAAAFWRGYDDMLVRVPKAVHALTCAPTGAGKGVYVQIPNLLTFRGSMVVVDPQGTLFKVTAWFREKVLGHRVIRMDPVGIAGPAATSARMNACNHIDFKHDAAIDQIRAMAEVMVKREPNEFQPFFNDWAIVIISSLIAFVCACEPDAAKRNLNVMRDLVCSKKSFTDAKEAMQKVPGLVGKMGAMLDIPTDRELAAILATVQRHLAWMDSPIMVASLAESTWHPSWLRSGKVTVYLILPSDMLATHSGLMRLWIGTILQVLASHGPDEQHPILFMIDEAAHIGKIQKLEDAITLMRAYGIRIWLFFQSINQLQKSYGDNAQTILDNMSVQQFFGINAFESADHISRRVGDCTILVESINRNRGRTLPTGTSREPQPGSVSTGNGVTVSEAGRRLLRPEEILVLPEDVSLTFYKNLHVIPTQLVPYYADPAFKAKRFRPPGVGLAGGLFSVASVAVAAAVLMVAAVLTSPAAPRWPGVGMTRYEPGMAVPPPPSLLPYGSEFTIPPEMRGAESPWSIQPSGYRKRPELIPGIDITISK